MSWAWHKEPVKTWQHRPRGRAGWEATGESARPMPGKPVPCWQWLGARARLIRTPPDPLGRPGTALPSRQEEPTSTRVKRPAMGRRSWASWAGSWAPPTPRGAISVPCCNLLIWGRCQSITVGIAPLSSQAAGLQSRLCHTQAVWPGQVTTPPRLHLISGQAGAPRCSRSQGFCVG